MDALSDVLRVTRLTGAVFFTTRVTAPWAIRSLPPERLAPLLGVRPDCFAMFHVVVEGRCRFALDGGEPVEVEAGTMVLLPHGDEHVMASGPGLEPEPVTALLPARDEPGIPNIEGGGGGDAARFVCGYLHCDQRFNPLIGALPGLIVACPRRGLLRALPRAGEGSGRSSTSVETTSIDGDGDGGGATDTDRWLATTLRYAMEEAESDRPGSPAMLARLTEVLYLEVLRRYMRELPAERTGWLAGLRDPEVGRALRLVHAHPDRKWTVDALAREVGLSRSALAQRFSDLVGEPPMQYLAGWRMHLARHLLKQPALSIAQVAKRVGYG
ncbi:MAG: AraC family transcriptional regulator, partial [Gemmatimonadota bacterium]